MRFVNISTAEQIDMAIRVNTTEKETRKLGIDIIGDVPWGSRICLFYQNVEELIDVLVSYFKTGLKNNETCLWIASDPLNKEAVMKILRKSVYNLDKYLENGQMEISSHAEWFYKNGSLDLTRMLESWLRKHKIVIARGFDGLRCTYDTNWLEKKDWPRLIELGRASKETDYKNITICSISLEKCGAPEIIDAVSNHHFSLIKRGGKWDSIEKYERSKMELTLDKRVKELRCLYDIANITGTPDNTIREKFSEIVNILPRAFQHPDITFAQITLNDEYFKTGNHRRTDQKIAADIIVLGSKVGTVEVGYTRVPPVTDNGLFSKEERLLLDAVAERLGAIAEHGQAEENIIIERNLGMLLSATNSMQKAFKFCLEAAITVSEMDCGAIYAVDKKTGEINLAHHQGLSPTFVRDTSHYEVDSPYAHLAMAGKPIYVKYAEIDIPLKESSTPEGLKAIAIVPIKHEGEVIACINVYSHTHETIPPLGRDCIETIASQIGSTIARISMEDALRQSEEKFSKAFRTIPDMITITTLKEGRIIEINDSVYRFMGYKREEVIGKSTLDLNIWVDTKERQKIIQLLQEKRRANNEEATFRTKSGELRNVMISAELIDFADEPCFIVVTTDMTEKKQSEELLRSVSHSSPLGIYIVQDEKLQYVNPQFQKITGFNREELLGQELLSIVASEDIDVVKSSMVFTLREASSYPCEYRILNKTGQIKWVMQTVAPIHYEGREAILGNLMDITERKYLERKVIEYEELSKMKSDLLATVSHELRTPLATIKGYSTMILDYFAKLTSDETKEYLKSIDNSTDRLSKLVDNLLETSRLEAGLLHLEKTSVSLPQLIERIAEEASIRDNHRHIFRTKSKKLPRANIDAKRIRQVLDNLIDNATKYAPADTEIEISAEQSGYELIISVTDKGPGIPAEELTNIFDRMYRIEQRVYSGADGMGLGLYICQRLVTAHGGRIWAESTVGKGSTIKFTLPITSQPRNKKAIRSPGSK
jgi:PAS domain S-box-containing protein